MSCDVPSAPVSDEIATLLTACAVSRRWAEQDLGPYHRESQLERRNVVEDREGVALQLGIRLVDDGAGDAAQAGATVEIWQCDGLGRYSGFPPPSAVAVTAAPCTST